MVVDPAAHIVIDKKCNFNLLNSTPPPQLWPPKQKLHEFFKDLQDNRKLIVAELKMVCHNRLQHMQFKFEAVKPINKIPAIREWIEILAAQKELMHLGETLKKGFADVFSEIPHIDQLPKDVYY